MLPAAGQLEMRAGSRHLQERAVVAGVVTEAAELPQTDPVAVERDELLEPIGVSGDAQLHALESTACPRRYGPMNNGRAK